ncbi:MAG: amidohydrolase family protein [Mariniblastus sp.]
MSKTIRIPLLKDHHSHPLFYSAFGKAVALHDVATKDEANRLIGEKAAENSSDITIACGWRSNRFRWTESEIKTMPPVAIFNVSLHSLLINSNGMEVLKSRYGDVVEKLNDRVWYENNLRVVLNWFANLDASVEGLRAFYESQLLNGVYYLEEMLLVDEGEIRLFESSGLMERTKFWASPDTFESLSNSAKRAVEGLKLFTDGAIGSRTAAMKRTYLKEPSENFGMLIYSDDDLLKTIDRCFETEKSLAVHAIGDRAIEQVIGCFEKLSSELSNIPVVRIEHAQMISLDQARRAKELGVSLCMQPNFSSDSIDYSDRMDSLYCQMNNPFRMLIDEVGFRAGEDLIFGSDGMPHGVEAAANQSFFPTIKSQRLTEQEFVQGYCVSDQGLGSIEIEMNDERVVSTHVIVS